MKKIAIEEHFATPEDWALLQGLVARGELSMIGNPYRLVHDRIMEVNEKRLREMDETGIAMQVLSLTIAGLQHVLDPATAIRMAKHTNDALAEVVARHPTRFAAFAALPLADPMASADELERAVKQLGFKGALINEPTRGAYLDDQKFWIIYERAQALNVPIYLHPAQPRQEAIKAYYEGYPELTGPLWSFGVDIGTQALRLIFSGVFDAFPNFTLILGHMGEMLPFMLWRFDKRWELADFEKKLKKRPSDYIKENMLVTTSGMFSYPPLLCTMLALGADRILFAVDYPYESNYEGAQFIESVPISDADKEKICHLNAERWLKL